MNKKISRRYFFSFICIAVIVLSMFFANAVSSSYANDKGYITDSFITEITANENYVFDVRETINVDFKSPKHGIFRYIPVSSKEYDIKGVSVSGGEFSVGSEHRNGNDLLEIKIGDPDELLNGKHQYVISYKIIGKKNKSGDKDYIKIDLLPSEWNTEISYAKAVLKMPKKIDFSKGELFHGGYGSKSKLDFERNYNFIPNDEMADAYGKMEFNVYQKENLLTVEANNLSAYNGVSYRSMLPDNYWVGAKDNEFARKSIGAAAIVFAFISFLMWFIFGRDPKIVQTVEFYPPEDLTPAEVGVFIDGKVDDKDLNSLFMYLANKGYISITEENKDNIVIKKVKEIDRTEKDFVKSIYRALFPDDVSVLCDMGSLDEKFGKKYQSAKDQLSVKFEFSKGVHTVSSFWARVVSVFSMIVAIIYIFLQTRYITGDYFYIFIAVIEVIALIYVSYVLSKCVDGKNSMKKSKRISYRLLGIVFTIIFVTIGYLSIDRGAGNSTGALLFAVSSIVSIVCIAFMSSINKMYTEIMGRIYGFRTFIKEAEIPRIEQLVEEDPNYFFNVLPYAYIFGLTDKWVKKFDKIHIPRPDWLEGETNFYATPFFYSSMMMRTEKFAKNAGLEALISDINSDGGFHDGGSSGGFGGGGFTGGGFGGGGGGAW